MRQAVPTPRYATAANVVAALLAISTFFVSPIYETLLIGHVLMILVIGAWILIRSPRAMFVALSVLIILASYLLIVGQVVEPGERMMVESLKYGLILVFIAAVIDFPVLARNTLFFLAFLIPISLLLYVTLSSDPLVYGGRLGVSMAGGDETDMISANTIAFAVNISVATFLGRKSKWFYYLAPVYVVLIYLTQSRGGLLSFGVIGVAYFLRTRRMIYVAILGLLSLLLFVDMNSEAGLLVQTFRLDDATGSGRTVLYEMMWENMLANPITFLIGHGPGNVYFEIYRGTIIISAHNAYIEMVYTFGLLGVVATLYFILNVLRNFWKLPMDVLLYAILLMTYGLSEDLMGSHNLLAMGLIVGLTLYCAKALRAQRRLPSPGEHLASAGAGEPAVATSVAAPGRVT